MVAPAHDPKIYHILHVDRLPSVISSGGLFSDGELNGRTDLGTVIGMGDLKSHRLTRPVDCHTNLAVGSCVPFYFCSRSVMLYVIRQANHPSLSYRGGQQPIVHLEANMREVTEWADEQRLRWAYSLGNASANYAEFRTGWESISEVNWGAVHGSDFSSPGLKDAKQAEFLVERMFPWALVRRIGVINGEVARLVYDSYGAVSHRPPIEITRNWYF